MSDVVIQVDGLWKKYRLGVLGTGTLRHDFNRWLHRTLGKGDPYAKVGEGQKIEAKGTKKEDRSSKIAPDLQSPISDLPHPASSLRDDEMWALRDVSFEVKQGEILGIIGRNGAGKSTLLKILSRVTVPTTGEVRVKGRIASLLEVGTGFHPELTGRENIFLNGAILGMTKGEIKKKFDEIVAFSEVEKFIDTPVKRYSSGMYVRLAFAVAAHLDPEILIVDEVLAVGDASFQKKCIGKMKDVAVHGRTVLFVSHNMAAVKTLCSRALLLIDGYVKQQGPPGEMISTYLQAGSRDTASEREWVLDEEAPGNEKIRLRHIRVRPPPGETEITVDSGALIQIAFHNERPGINLACSAFIHTSDGFLLFETGSILTANSDSRRGTYSMEGVLPGHLLNSGRYWLTLIMGQDQAYVLFKAEEIVSFTVEHTIGRGRNLQPAPGVIRPILEWQHEFRGD